MMVLAFGDLIMHAALARARHPTGLTIARIKTTSRLICTRRSAGVRSSRIFGPRRGLRTVGTDMVGLHIAFRTRPRPVRAEPDQQDLSSSTPKHRVPRLTEFYSRVAIVRRPLPSLNALRSFDAAARHQAPNLTDAMRARTRAGQSLPP